MSEEQVPYNTANKKDYHISEVHINRISDEQGNQVLVLVTDTGWKLD